MRSTFLVALIGTAAAQQGWTAGKGAVVPARQATEPVYTCPFGFALNGKICEKPITEQPQILCQQGILNGLECLLEGPRSARCPVGTTAQGKQCVQPLQTPAARICPPGFLETFGGCEIQEPLPLVEVCEIGSREGPQCATVDLLPYTTQTYCPPGFEEHAKGGCWRSATYDCTPLQVGKGGLSLRGLIGKEPGMTLPVNPKVNVIKQTCERKEGAAYITDRNCPPAFTDTGSGCMMKNYFPTTTKCSNGGPMETCFTLRNAPFLWECAPGTTLNGQICLSQLVLPEEVFCPIGYDNGFACVQSFPPSQVCPPGLTLTGGICIGLETAQPQVTVTVTCTGKNCHQQ